MLSVIFDLLPFFSSCCCKTSLLAAIFTASFNTKTMSQIELHQDHDWNPSRTQLYLVGFRFGVEAPSHYGSLACANKHSRHLLCCHTGPPRYLIKMVFIDRLATFTLNVPINEWWRNTQPQRFCQTSLGLCAHARMCQVCMCVCVCVCV